MRPAMVAALVCLAACAPAPPPAITRVDLRIVPATGRAWVSFDSTGFAKGGHFSGSPPMVHIDTATIPADSARAIFAAARALGNALLATRGPAVDTARPGTATLAVTFSDSTQAQFVWGSAGQPADPRVQAVLQHVVANRVGGW